MENVEREEKLLQIEDSVFVFVCVKVLEWP